MSFLRKLNSVYSKIHKVKNFAPTCIASQNAANAYGGSGTNQVFTIGLSQIRGDTKNCGNATVSSSQLNLDAGTYLLHAWTYIYGNDHSKDFIYNATLSAYINLDLSGMTYGNNDGRTQHVCIPSVKFETRTSLQVRVLNEQNVSSAFAGGSFDNSWDPGSDTNGNHRPGTVLLASKLI
jgi:hypothetical protein